MDILIWTDKFFFPKYKYKFLRDCFRPEFIVKIDRWKQKGDKLAYEKEINNLNCNFGLRLYPQRTLVKKQVRVTQTLKMYNNILSQKTPVYLITSTT